MTSLPDNQCQILVVGRKRLEDALRSLAASLDSEVKWASISYNNGQLTIVAGSATSNIQASGHWPETILIDASWVRNVRRGLLPPGDPVVLRAEVNHFYTNNFSQPYSLDVPRKIDDPTRVPPRMRSARVEKAAKLLKNFRVTPADLETMIDSVQSRGDPVWRRDEGQMINAVAKAWTLLAPLGVETGDLRNLIDHAVRNAFVRT